MAIIFFTILRTQIADLRYANESGSSKTQPSVALFFMLVFGPASAQQRVYDVFAVAKSEGENVAEPKERLTGAERIHAERYMK